MEPVAEQIQASPDRSQAVDQYLTSLRNAGDHATVLQDIEDRANDLNRQPSEAVVEIRDKALNQLAANGFYERGLLYRNRINGRQYRSAITACSAAQVLELRGIT